MSTNATRATTITYAGDNVGVQTLSAAANAASPGQMEMKILASGANTITPPAGATPVSVTIVPPAGNVITLTLKGVTGDTGIALHLTDPTTIALGSPTATFCLTAGSLFTNPTRFYWT